VCAWCSFSASLAVPGCPWLSLAAPGLLLAAPGCCWLLLLGCSRLSLAARGLLLAAPGRPWLLILWPLSMSTVDPKNAHCLGSYAGIMEPSWAVLGYCWGSWDHISHLWDILGAILGPSWAVLGPFWGHLGVILGSSWGHLGVILATVGTFGSSWAIVEPYRGVLAILGHLRFTLAILGRHLGALFWDNFGAILGLVGAKLRSVGAKLRSAWFVRSDV
jgi:hypothetical protein